MYALFFKPITANTNDGNHNLPWAPHRLLPKILIFMIMCVHNFLIALSTRATTIMLQTFIANQSKIVYIPGVVLLLIA